MTGSDLDEIVTQLLTPRRREPRASRAAWTTRAELATEHGPVVWWSAGTGPAVLAVHGWEGTHADFDAFVEPLVARGLRVVAADMPAHGESAGTSLTLPRFGNAVIALAQTLGEPLHAIVSHSAGGPAIAAALDAGVVARRAVLIASPHRYERFVRAMAEEFGIDGDALVDAFIARGIDVPSLDMRLTVAGRTEPALVIYPDDDTMVRLESSEAIVAAWRGSRLVRVPGLGHRGVLRDPGVVELVVDFIAGAPEDALHLRG